MVDAQVSGTCEGFFMKVQVLSGAPIKKNPRTNASFFYAQFSLLRYFVGMIPSFKTIK